MFGKVVVSQGKGNVSARWCQVAVLRGLVNNAQGPGATGFFKVGGHTSDGVKFEVCVAATAELFCCFERSGGVFGKIAEKGEGVVLGRGKEVWLLDGLLTAS